ncbi:MAG: putative porin, partial [Chloroflexia bacterium]|nr:putative porin [Chloroflexia bacterium]
MAKQIKADNFGGSLLISKGIIIGKRQSDFYFKLKIAKYSPFIFQQRYESNHFSWNNENEFFNIDEQEVRAGLSVPSIRLKGEFATKFVTNYIYCDANAHFQQIGDTVLNLTSIRLHKDFKLGRFFIKNKIVYQLPPNMGEDIISTPEWSFYNTTYFDLNHFLDKISVEAQVGFDITYCSKFKALGYNPVVGQFHQSNSEVYAGEYPIVNAFINMRIKTVLLFFKYENLVNMFRKDKYYFILDKYAMNIAAFRF